MSLNEEADGPIMGLSSTEAFTEDSGKDFIHKRSFLKEDYKITELCFQFVGDVCKGD